MRQIAAREPSVVTEVLGFRIPQVNQEENSGQFAPFRKFDARCKPDAALFAVFL
jgi:hypothetical protein